MMAYMDGEEPSIETSNAVSRKGTRILLSSATYCGSALKKQRHASFFFDAVMDYLTIQQMLFQQDLTDERRVSKRPKRSLTLASPSKRCLSKITWMTAFGALTFRSVFTLVHLTKAKSPS